MYEIPPMLNGTAAEQIKALRDYLVRLAFGLNQEKGRTNEPRPEDPELSARQRADRKFNEVRELINYMNRLPAKHWPFKLRADGAAVGKSAETANRLELADGWVLALNDAQGNTVTLSAEQLQALLAML